MDKVADWGYQACLYSMLPMPFVLAIVLKKVKQLYLFLELLARVLLLGGSYDKAFACTCMLWPRMLRNLFILVLQGQRKLLAGPETITYLLVQAHRLKMAVWFCLVKGNGFIFLVYDKWFIFEFDFLSHCCLPAFASIEISVKRLKAQEDISRKPSQSLKVLVSSPVWCFWN